MVKSIWEKMLEENSDSAYASKTPEDKIITEPDESTEGDDEETPADSEKTEELPDIYELYPGLSDVDVTCPCAILDFFKTVCDELEDSEEDESEEVELSGDEDIGESVNFNKDFI